jgi:hypothetical protein
VSPIPKALADIFSEIERALEAQLYHSVLALALTLPDICASLEADPNEPYWASAKKYAAWFDANAASRFKSLTGADCYRLRGGVLHRGQFGHRESRFDRVFFLPAAGAISVHDSIVSFSQWATLSGKTREVIFGGIPGRPDTGAILHMRLDLFCQAMVGAVQDWIVTKAGDAHVQANLPNLMRYRPEGFPPYMVGVPVIT